MWDFKLNVSGFAFRVSCSAFKFNVQSSRILIYGFTWYVFVGEGDLEGSEV